MKPAKTLFIFLISPLVAGATPELVGDMATPDGPRFVLADGAAVASEWLKVGDSFGGYTIESYDPATGVVTLGRGAEKLELSLRATRVADPPPRRGFTRERAIEYVGRAYRMARVVFRGLRLVQNGRMYWKCLEVWKAESGRPLAGEIVCRPDFEPAGAANPPLPDAELDFSHATEEIVCFAEYPLRSKSPTGGFPLSQGKLNLYPDLPAAELRDLLTRPGN